MQLLHAWNSQKLPFAKVCFASPFACCLGHVRPKLKFLPWCIGFLIAAVIAERATGKSFEELMQHVPLAMNSAGFWPTREGRLRGHRAGKQVTFLGKSDDGVPMMFTPAGNLHMSLHAWAQFYLDQLAGSKGAGKLLKPESYRLMQTVQPQSPAGLDWGVQKSIAGRRGPVLTHRGSTATGSHGWRCSQNLAMVCRSGPTPQRTWAATQSRISCWPSVGRIR